VLAADDPAAPGQDNWRWCNKCQMLAFAGADRNGACPAGDEHDHNGSGNYVLNFAGGQDNWRWCNKCQGLTFAGGSVIGACAAGGQHDHGRSGNYSLLHAEETQGQAYTEPTGPIGQALRAALIGPEKKLLKVFGHEFNVKPVERIGPTKAVGQISHCLSLRPDDQVYYTIEKVNGTIRNIDVKINRGGIAPIAAPIISALGQYYGGVAIRPGQVEDVGRKLGAILDGSWERAAQALIGYIAADPRL